MFINSNNFSILLLIDLSLLKETLNEKTNSLKNKNIDFWFLWAFVVHIEIMKSTMRLWSPQWPCDSTMRLWSPQWDYEVHNELVKFTMRLCSPHWDYEVHNEVMKPTMTLWVHNEIMKSTMSLWSSQWAC